MGPSDYLKLGDWNAQCARCGKKRKGSQLVRMWTGNWVCPEHWEARHPQDFVKSIQEHSTPPFVQHSADLVIGFCTPNGSSAVAGFAVAGCAVAGYIHPAFDATVIEATP